MLADTLPATVTNGPAVDAALLARESVWAFAYRLPGAAEIHWAEVKASYLWAAASRGYAIVNAGRSESGPFAELVAVHAQE